ASGTDSHAETPPPPIPTASPEAAQREYADFADRLGEHARDARDPGWAPRAARVGGGGGGGLAGPPGFRPTGGGCRMSSCVATVEWPTFGAAMMNYRRLVSNPVEINCRRTSAMEPPADDAQPYQAHILYRCEHARAEGQ